MPETKGKALDTASVAANYIIELKDGPSRAFVICSPTLIIVEGDNWGGMTADDLARYIEDCRLSAAPLPGRPLRAEEFRSGPGHGPSN